MEIFSFLNMPILILIMTLSFTETDFSAFKNLKKSRDPFLAGILINYCLIFFMFLFLGRLFKIEGELWAGLVLTAATPPGLAIMPFASVVGGNMFFATAATLSAFIATLLFTPGLTAFFIGSNAISYLSLLRMLFYLIIIPLILGLILQKIYLKDFAKKIHGGAVNIGFGVIFAVIFGINRNFLFGQPVYIVKLLLISFIVVFGLAFMARFILRFLDYSVKVKKSIVLVATIKNSIFGATAGLSLLGPQGAIPGTVVTFVTLVYLMFVDKILQSTG